MPEFKETLKVKVQAKLTERDKDTGEVLREINFEDRDINADKLQKGSKRADKAKKMIKEVKNRGVKNGLNK